MSKKNGNGVVFRKSTRPIDKRLIFISKSVTGVTQVATNLLTVTIPCTITGLRWNISVLNQLSTSSIDCHWAIVVIRDGLAASIMAFSDGAEFYTPEANVLAFGTVILSKVDTVGSRNHLFEGVTKTMRKMMGGDVLEFIVTSSNGVSLNVRGIVQYFCKF